MIDLEFAALLGSFNCQERANPNRVMRHLVLLELHDLANLARRDPASVRRCAP